MGYGTEGKSKRDLRTRRGDTVERLRNQKSVLRSSGSARAWPFIRLQQNSQGLAPLINFGPITKVLLCQPLP